MSLSKNTLLNVIGNVVPLLFGAVTVPLLIDKLGVEKFGVLTILWTIIGYFSLFDFGVGRAITQQVASSLLNKNEKEIPAVIKSGLEFNIATGILGMIILGCISYFLSYSILNVSVDLQKDVFYSLLVAALGIPFATVGAGQRGALEGFEWFKLSNVARIFLGSSIFIFPFISYLISGPSLTYIALWLVFARILNCGFLWIFLKKLPCENIWTAKVDKNIRKKIFGFGAWMSVTNLVSPLLVNADRFFISSIMGASMVAFYTVPMEFLVRILIIPNALGSSLLPRLARKEGENKEGLKEIFFQSVKFIAIAMFVICFIAALASYPLMKIFISKDFADSAWVICLILSFGIFLNGVAYVPYTALHAAGNAKSTGLLHATEFLLYIPTLYLLVKFLGLTGAAIAWSGRVLIDTFFMFYLYRKMV